MNKKTSERIHAQKRARQRYGVKLSKKDYRKLCRQIRSGKSMFIKKQSNTRTVHDVCYGSVIMRAVYDKSRGAIVTFLHK